MSGIGAGGCVWGIGLGRWHGEVLVGVHLGQLEMVLHG